MYRPTSPPSRSTPPRRSPATVEEKLPDQILIGQRLLKTGLLTQAQIAQALREKKQNYLKVGEVCLEHGWITASNLYALLPSTCLGIGELLILRGNLTFEQLKTALAHQRESDQSDRKLGEILQDLGWIDDPTLNEALDQQTRIRELFYLDAWQALQTAQVQLPSSEPISESGSKSTPAPSTQPQRCTQPESIRIPSHLQAQHPGLKGKTNGSQIRRTRSDPSASAEPDTAPSWATTASVSRQTSPREMPVAEAKYQSRIASLELQMDMQQREWQALTEQMNQQVAEFHARYQERIADLELQLQQQQQEQIPTQYQLQFYQQRVQSLEAEIASHQAQQRTHQTQVLTLQAQIKQLETDLEQIQEHRQQEQTDLHHHYQRQLQETEILMQQQQQHAESQQTELQSRLQRAKECIDNLTLELAESYTAQDRIQKQSEEQIQQLQQALAQAESSAPSPQVEDLQGQLQVYQQNLASLQQQLQAQQTQNRWLAAKLIHLQEAPSSLQQPDHSVDGSIPTSSLEPLLARLQAAALISETQVQLVLQSWPPQAGDLIQFLATELGLSEATIAFFQTHSEADPTHSSQTLPQILLAADLVTEADLQMIRRLYPSLPPNQLGEALAEQGVIRPGTAQYFIQRLRD